MSGVYSRLSGSALRLITRYGSEITFIRKVEGDYDPSIGKSSETEINYTANAVVDEYKASEFNDTILQGDLKLICEAGDYQLDDFAVVNSTNYRVIGINSIHPADIEVAAMLQVRA